MSEKMEFSPETEMAFRRKERPTRTEGKRVTIESPLAGDVRANMEYAKLALADSLNRGEAPYASHLLYTLVLEDTVPDQREKGLLAAMAYARGNDLTAVYSDRGISGGMVRGIREAQAANIPIVYRELDSLRRTGRTTGMLTEAVRDFKEGKNVLVLMKEHWGRQSAMFTTRQLLEDTGAVTNRTDSCEGVKLGEAALWVATISDWIRFRGTKVDSFFIDHHAWSAGLQTYEALTHFNGR